VIGPTQRPLLDNKQQSKETNIHAPSGIRTRTPNNRTAADPRLIPHGNWHRLTEVNIYYKLSVNFHRVARETTLRYCDVLSNNERFYKQGLNLPRPYLIKQLNSEGSQNSYEVKETPCRIVRFVALGVRRFAMKGACLWPKRFSTARREVGDTTRHGRRKLMKIWNGMWGGRLLCEWVVVQAFRMAERVRNGKETRVGGLFLTADLNIKILCAKMIPNNLSEDQKLARRQVLRFWTKLMKRFFGTGCSPSTKLVSWCRRFGPI